MASSNSALSLMQPFVHQDNKPSLHSAKFAIWDHIFFRSYGGNRNVKWIPGRISSSLGTRMFTVQCADGIHRRHIDQMREVFARACSNASRGASHSDDERAASPPRSPIRAHPTRDNSPAAAEDGRIASPPRDVAASPVLRRPPTRYSH